MALIIGVAKYKKKPVVIEAIQYTQNNIEEVFKFCLNKVKRTGNHITTGDIVISTLEGEMTAKIGAWIIKGIQGEFYPCKPDIFEKTYDTINMITADGKETKLYQKTEPDEVNNDKLTASEALFGFVAWLTTRKEKTILSSSDDAAPLVKLINVFCDTNKLAAPRDDYPKNLKHPKHW